MRNGGKNTWSLTQYGTYAIQQESYFIRKGQQPPHKLNGLLVYLHHLYKKTSSMQESQTQSKIMLNFKPDVTLPGCVCNSSSQRPLLTAGKARLLLSRTPPQTVRAILQIGVLLYKFWIPYMWIYVDTPAKS